MSYEEVGSSILSSPCHCLDPIKQKMQLSPAWCYSALLSVSPSLKCIRSTSGIKTLSLVEKDSGNVSPINATKQLKPLQFDRYFFLWLIVQAIS